MTHTAKRRPDLNSALIILHFALALAFSLPGSLDAQGGRATNVIVDAVLRRPVEDEISIVGRTRPRHGGLLASETDGKIVKKVVEAGGRAAAGDVLVRLENQQLRAAYLEAKADLELQEYNFKRTDELFKQDVVPEQSLNEARYQLARARSKFSDLRDRVAKLNVRAPYTGHVVQIVSDIGEWVKRGDGIVRYISTDTILVATSVPERHIGAISLGDTASVFIEAIGTDPIPGLVTNVVPEGFAESHTFPVVVGTLNPGGRIKSNMSARVVFSIAKPDSVTLVHKDAIVSSARGQTVFIASDGKALPRNVQAGLAYNGYVAVTGDLKPGDLAIVRGNERLRPEQAVKVIRQLQ